VSVGYGLGRLDLENRNQCECSEERYHHYKPFSLSILVITEILVLEQLQNRQGLLSEGILHKKAKQKNV